MQASKRVRPGRDLSIHGHDPQSLSQLRSSGPTRLPPSGRAMTSVVSALAWTWQPQSDPQLSLPVKPGVKCSKSGD